MSPPGVSSSVPSCVICTDRNWSPEEMSMNALRLSALSFGPAETVTVCRLASPDVWLMEIQLSTPSSVRMSADHA